MMSLTGPLVTEEEEGGTKEEKEGEKEGEIGTRRASNEESQISSPFSTLSFSLPSAIPLPISKQIINASNIT